jgi:hypothetical protein
MNGDKFLGHKAATINRKKAPLREIRVKLEASNITTGRR